MQKLDAAQKTEREEVLDIENESFYSVLPYGGVQTSWIPDAFD
jgi:hypothetical protein